MRRATARWSSGRRQPKPHERRTKRARRGGRALSVQADGLQGRIRGRAALHRRQFPKAGRRASSAATSCVRIPSRAAAARQTRSGHRRAPQDQLRAVDDGRVQAPGAAANSCAARRSTSFGYSTERRTERQLDRRLRSDCWMKSCPSSRPTIIRWRSGLPRFRKKSAASVTSRPVILSLPRPTRLRCWSSSAPASRPCSRPRNKAAQSNFTVALARSR